MSTAIEVVNGGSAAAKAIEQRVVNPADNFAAAFFVSKPGTESRRVTLEGAIVCHVCRSSFPFRLKVTIDGGMSDNIQSCSCGSQVSILSCSRDGGYHFIIVKPFTSQYGLTGS